MERIYARRETRTSERDELLDELLCQDAITRDEYKQLNTMFAESLDEEMVLGLPPGEEYELKKVIHATSHNVIESDNRRIDGTFSSA